MVREMMETFCEMERRERNGGTRRAWGGEEGGVPIGVMMIEGKCREDSKLGKDGEVGIGMDGRAVVKEVGEATRDGVEIGPGRGKFGSTMTCRLRASSKHKDDGQTKFIKLNSQRQDIIIKYWVIIGSIHKEQG